VTLKRAYDETATRWALRFGTAYSGCGCPVSFEAEVTLKRILKSGVVAESPLKFWKRKQRAASLSGAKQDVETLNGFTPDERGALCPSTHNRVKVEGSQRIDGARSSMFSKKRNHEHPDPFTTYYVFVPRAVPRPGKRRRRSQLRRGSSSSRSTASTTDVYWGVAPYAFYGPYGLTNPWCMPMGVASELDGDRQLTSDCCAGLSAACSSGVHNIGGNTGGCASASACSTSGAMCAASGGAWGDGGCSGGDGGGGGGGCGGGGGGD
jgi:hypothetical protein